MSTNTTIFIRELKEICKEKNVKLTLSNTESVKYSKTIRTSAMKSNDYLEILVHESCHLDQYFEDAELWDACEKSDDVDNWIEGKEYANIESLIKAVKNLEIDCEVRAVAKIKKYNLPINISEYTQKANAYIWFHNYLYLKRFWPKPETAPNNLKIIWETMPKKFLNNYDVLPKKIHNLFDKHVK